MGNHPVAQPCNSPCPAGAVPDPDRSPASPRAPADAPSPREMPSVGRKPVNGKLCLQAQPTAAALQGFFAAPRLPWCKPPHGACKRDLLSPPCGTNRPPAPPCRGSPASAPRGELRSPWAGPRRTQVLEAPWGNGLSLMAGEMLRLEIADGSGWLKDEPCSESRSSRRSWPWATCARPARLCTRVYAELSRACAYTLSAAVHTHIRTPTPASPPPKHTHNRGKSTGSRASSPRGTCLPHPSRPQALEAGPLEAGLRT